MRSKITIKDIANELGIHHATVSRALRDHEKVKKSTRDKVRKKAVEMGYIPNRLAQGFRNQRSNTIGIIVPEVQHHFFAKFISEFTRIANRYGYFVMIFQSSEKLTNEMEIIRSLIGYHVAGVVCSISLETKNQDHFGLLNRSSIPYVFFDRTPAETDAPQVVFDNFQGAYKAVEMLVKSGKKRIAYLSFANHLNVFRDRLSGYLQALENYKIPLNADYIIEGGLLIEDGIKGAKQLMQLSQPPEAIIAVRDEVGVGVIKYLTDLKVQIPEEISIIGFDNDPIGLASHPALTTIKQSISELARKTYELLSMSITNELSDKNITIQPEIISRGSS